MRIQTEEVVKNNDAEGLARLLEGILDMQLVILIANKAMAQKTFSLERGLNIVLSEGTCSRADQAGL